MNQLSSSRIDLKMLYHTVQFPHETKVNVNFIVLPRHSSHILQPTNAYFSNGKSAVSKYEIYKANVTYNIKENSEENELMID